MGKYFKALVNAAAERDGEGNEPRGAVPVGVTSLDVAPESLAAGVEAPPPAASAPYLVIVRRDQPDVYRYLAGRCAEQTMVEVRLDQRVETTEIAAPDRRRQPPRFNAVGVCIVRRASASARPFVVSAAL